MLGFLVKHAKKQQCFRNWKALQFFAAGFGWVETSEVLRYCSGKDDDQNLRGLATRHQYGNQGARGLVGEVVVFWAGDAQLSSPYGVGHYAFSCR